MEQQTVTIYNREGRTSGTRRVAIGLPVYNGEAFLEEALQSLLGQTFTDFDLIISDNASTDRTEVICRSYAERDPRIIYVRQARNLGAGPNYRALLDHTSAELFKWAAHDDVIEPTFMEKCVAALDADPTATLAHSETAIINAQGERIDRDTRDMEDVFGTNTAKRFTNLLMTEYWCYDIFGVLRRSAMERTCGHADFQHSDGAMLVQMALQGPFARVREPLFLNRWHEAQFSRTALQDPDKILEWYDTSKSGSRKRQHWILLGSYFAGVNRLVGNPFTRVKCYWTLLRWASLRWNAYLLVHQLLGTMPRRAAASSS
ncbi:MAG: glycosyltransferase [Caulobacterales bacterium]|nr:glycosyltransferase [Caulobacterales bacterium]